MSKTKLHRMWINQPSTFHLYHKYHGRRVLVNLDIPDGHSAGGWDTFRAYFTDGPIESMRVVKSALSQGWPTSN